MKFEIVKEEKRIIGFNLVPEEFLWNEEKTREEKEFCKSLPKRIKGRRAGISFVIDAGRNRIVVENYYDNNKYFFKISEKTRKRSENILRIGYAFETTEDNIFKVRVSESKEERDRFPGNSKQRKLRKAKKASRKK